MSRPDHLGREPCEPCAGCWAPHAVPLACWPAVLDELLWELFGWLWLAGGRTELETWCPDEPRIAGVDDDELPELVLPRRIWLASYRDGYALCPSPDCPLPWCDGDGCEVCGPLLERHPWARRGPR